MELDKSTKRLLKKIFNEAGSNDSELVSGDKTAIVDNGHIVMCTAKSDLGISCIQELGNKIKPIDFENYDYWNNHFTKPGDSMYNSEIVSSIFDVLEMVSRKDDIGKRAIRMKMGKDSPLLVENEHFIFALAPRIDSE